MTALAIEVVVTQPTSDVVIGGIAGECVLAITALQRHDLDLLDGPGCPVGEANLFELVAAGAVVAEIAADGNLVAAVLQTQHQVAAGTGNDDVVGADIVGKDDGIDLVGPGIGVADDVLAPAAAEAIDIAPSATIERVVARTTIKDVVARLAVEVVGTFATQQQVIPSSARNPIATAPTT